MDTKFRIEKITVNTYTIPLKTPFRISCGEILSKNGLLVKVTADGVDGWGEASVDRVPFYAHETVGGAADIVIHTLAPILLGETFGHPDDVTEKMAYYRGNNFAKAAIDCAVWDIYGKMTGKPCWKLLGGMRDVVEVGPSVGIKSDPARTVDAVGKLLAEGDCRMKIKVCPGFDYEYIKAVREAFPEIRLMVDANSAYPNDSLDWIAQWDQFNLMMIEQPLNERDIYYHSLLRARIKNPVCLDESIHTMHNAHVCAALGSADIVNIKVCRVGGLTNARKIHDFCREQGIVNWIGSRVGSGVAEAARLAAASLPNCTLASDCVISGMYMADDILSVPYDIKSYHVQERNEPGLGIHVDVGKLKQYATVLKELKFEK